MDENLTHDPAFKAQVRGTIPGMAHWATSGPAGTFCGKCKHFADIPWGIGRTTRCGLYKKMVGTWGSKRLPAVTPSCRYYENDPTKEIK